MRMLRAGLLRSFLKHLSRVLVLVLTRVATSSAQKLHILLSCFRRFVTGFCSFPKYNIWQRPIGSPLEPCTALTDASSGWYAEAATPPVETPPGTAANNSQNSASHLPPHSTVIPFPQPASGAPSHAQVTVPDGRSFDVQFRTLAASNSMIRYDNRCHVDKRKENPGIPPCTLEFPNKSYGPWFDGILDWQSCVHPEGALYLYNAARRTYTEGEMDEPAFRLVNACIDKLHELCPISVNLDDHSIELVLQVTKIDDSSHKHATCQYYFVDHHKKTLFWLHHYEEATKDIFCKLGGVDDFSHIAYALESEYWAHCEHYPNHELKRDKLLKELRGFVVYALAEKITSDNSLSPFGADDLSRILDLINHLEVNAEAGDSHSTCVIARFMHYFSEAKFFNFCGLHCARLDADQSVYKETAVSFRPLTRTLSWVFDAMLFWAPQAHHGDLRRVWVDDCIIAPRWKDFSENLMAEWNGIAIYSTVMLAVDVSFLAVPNVNVQQSQSFGIIATYVSTTFITGSLISSLLLARQTQRYGPESAEGAANLLSKMTATPFGTKALAAIHGLPYAMLLWGMIFFASAFLYNVFKLWTRAMLATVASALVVVTMFILWFIWAAREVHIFRPLAQFVIDCIERVS